MNIQQPLSRSKRHSAIFILSLWLLAPGLSAQQTELIGDGSFQKGITLRDPMPGKIISCGKLIFNPKISDSAFWELSQWSSRFNLNTADRKTGKNREIYYENEGKKVALTSRNELILEIKAKAEYGDRIRQFHEDWPHLYIEQSLNNGISLGSCSALNYRLKGRLLYCENFMGKNFNPQLHTCHIVSHLIIRNMNPSSSEYQQSFLFSIPVYDFRYPYPPGENFVDTGTKEVITSLFVYGPSGQELWDGPLPDKKWRKAEADLLPYIKEAFQIARARLKWKDTAFDDLQITHFIMGWESEGTFNAAIQFKDLSLKAITKSDNQ